MMTKNELRGVWDDLLKEIDTYNINSSTSPLITLLKNAIFENCKYIHDTHTNKTYTINEDKRLIKIEKL